MCNVSWKRSQHTCARLLSHDFSEPFALGHWSTGGGFAVEAVRGAVTGFRHLMRT